MNAQKKPIKKQLYIMLGIVVGMFAFGFALVPIYSVFCKVTGLNGKVDTTPTFTASHVDMTRTVTVELLATLNDSLPPHCGEFRAEHKKFVLHPGEFVTTSYYIKNLTDKEMAVQAIPSVTPGLAAKHIQKVECFCFQRQPLNPLEGKAMPLVFTVSPNLPKDIHTLSLAYTLFDVTQN
jgi:cytochrome c oxidase assembly protein subunit 11